MNVNKQPIFQEWMNPANLNLNNKIDTISFLTHKKAYVEVADLVKNKNVLEIGCGAGYGSKYLSQFAEKITTVDLDEKSLKYAKENNSAPNINYIKANVLEGLPFESNFYDIIICFQVIEHINIEQSEEFLNELKRLLKNQGQVIFTTPNRKIRLQPFQRPINKYHMLEYSSKTLYKTLKNVFNEVEIKGLKGSPEIVSEILKYKSTMFKAYLRNPVRRIVVHLAKLMRFEKLNSFFEKRGKGNRQIRPDSTESFDFTLNDLKFENIDLNLSIDLMGICKK